MSNYIRTIFAVMAVWILLFSGCSRNSSSDLPLTPTYNASVYVGEDNHILFAVNPVNGIKNWQFSAAAPIQASPLIYNERVYIGSNSLAGSLTTTPPDSLYKLDAQTGALIKTFYDNTNPLHIIATPIASGSNIYLACTNGNLYCLDTGTFHVNWTFSAGGSIRSSPVIFNGFVYFGCDNGTVCCVNDTYGTQPPLWPWSVPGVDFTSSPAIGFENANDSTDTMLCIGGNDNMYCLQLFASPYAAAPYSLLWTYTTGGAVSSSPTIYGGSCVFGSGDFNIYCLDIKAGFKRWIFPTNSSVTSSPYAYNNMIYVGSDDNCLYAIKFLDGVQKWLYRTAGSIKSSPIAYQGSVLVGSYDKTLYAIDTAFGQMQWQFKINHNIDCSPAIDNNTGGFGINSSISGNTN